MVSATRGIIAIILIFTGIIAFLSGIRTLVTFFIIEQIPVVGDLIKFFAPNVAMEQTIAVLVGIASFALGLLLLRKKKD